MDRRVDGERQAELGHPAGDLQLLRGGAGIGADPFGVLGVDVLERDLDVVEPALDEVFQPATIKGDGGGDQVRVEAGLGGGRDDVLEILARRGLAARQMHLQDAHLAGLAHHRAPHLGGKLLVDALELDRVRAIRALQGTAMRQLGEQANGCALAQRRLRRRRSRPRSARRRPRASRNVRYP